MIRAQKTVPFCDAKARPGSLFGPVFRAQTGARKTNIYTTQQLILRQNNRKKKALGHGPSLPAPFFDLVFYRQTQRQIASKGSEPSTYTSKRRRWAAASIHWPHKRAIQYMNPRTQFYFKINGLMGQLLFEHLCNERPRVILNISGLVSPVVF